jgi:hypothetical protein
MSDIASYAGMGRAVAAENRVGRGASYSAILKLALDRSAAENGKHLIDHAVDLAYKHKDILKAIISKIIPEATSGEAASMRRIILLCPDSNGRPAEVLSYSIDGFQSKKIISTSCPSTQTQKECKEGGNAFATTQSNSTLPSDFAAEDSAPSQDEAAVYMHTLDGGGIHGRDVSCVPGLLNMHLAPKSESNPSQTIKSDTAGVGDDESTWEIADVY